MTVAPTPILVPTRTLPATLLPIPTPIPKATDTTIIPARIDVPAGGRFAVEVVVRARPSHAVDTVQVYLDFDPDMLEALKIQPGNSLEYELQSGFDNAAGEVDYAAGTLGSSVARPFTFLTVNFRTLERLAEGPTTIFLAGAAPRRTRAVLAGMDTTGLLASATVAPK